MEKKHVYEQTDGQAEKHKVVFVLWRLMDELHVVGYVEYVFFFFFLS